jgi:predicted SnoaL-like aldol condensation-catalyzing enzyme
MNTPTVRRSARITALAILVGILSTLTMAASAGAQHDPDSPADVSNQAAASTLFEIVFNGEDADAPGALISADAVIHTPYGEFVGPEGLSEYLGIVRRTYPDATFEISNVIEQGDTAVVLWTMTASRVQVDPTEQPTDVSVRQFGETAITVADGQIAEVQLTNGTVVVLAPDIVVSGGPILWA